MKLAALLTRTVPRKQSVNQWWVGAIGMKRNGKLGA